jgi:hypothetical protein
VSELGIPEAQSAPEPEAQSAPEPEAESVEEAVVDPQAGEAEVSPGLESDTIGNSGLPRTGSSETDQTQ